MDNLTTLAPNQITLLQQQGNTADDWSLVKISPTTDLALLRGNHFAGSVEIGIMQADRALARHGLSLPEGITNSWISNCSIGDHCAIHRVAYMSNYEVENHVLLFNVGRLTSSLPLRFDPIEVMNENGGRAIRPFKGMTIGDAFLWAKCRDRQRLLDRFEQMALQATPERASVGSYATMVNCQTIFNVIVMSTEQAPTTIADAISVENGIVGFGCRVEQGSVLKNFLLGENVKVEYVARINDSVVGDNSTIARCEVGNSLIFPAHEQHHNNSFLIAANVQGQSNLAAGCTIGSNHNGRTADGEIVAGRGFWPGLCVSFKHSSTFASYCLAAKGDYPNELNITLPFALINNNVAKNRLEVMPAYWWLYNMYSLNRNEHKFAARDRRTFARQHIEFSPLAPDTVEEIMAGRELLRHWTEMAYLASFGKDGEIEVRADAMEHGKRHVVVVKAAQAYRAYEQMLYYYIGKTLTHDGTRRELPSPSLAGQREIQWYNVGGQLVSRSNLENILSQIESGSLASFDAVHQHFDALWEAYPSEREHHAYQLLCHLTGVAQIGDQQWQKALMAYDEACRYVAQQIRLTREKDDTNPFRRMTFANDAEMHAVLG